MKTINDMTKNDYFKINGHTCVKLGSVRISEEFGTMYVIYDLDKQVMFEEQGNTGVHYLGKFKNIRII